MTSVLVLEFREVNTEFEWLCVSCLPDDRYVVLCGDHAGGAYELWSGSAGHPSP